MKGFWMKGFWILPMKGFFPLSSLFKGGAEGGGIGG